MRNKKLKIALIQISASASPERNLKMALLMMEKALRQKIDMICLPEVFLLRGPSELYSKYAEPIPGPMSKILSQFCSQNKVSLLAGSLVERYKGKIFNTAVFFNKSGKIISKYRKIHLFKTLFKNKKNVDETKTFDSGKNVVYFQYLGWKFGMSICYDLRFPELYRKLSENQADVIFVPSNFTHHTGKDHWECLLRARAIENQAYVIAPNQCGKMPQTNLKIFGNSMIIDPWGKVLKRAGQNESIIIDYIEYPHLERIRKNFPVLHSKK